ncbi:YetF domain-containing protein [Halalkalibacter alkaliphilus]
MLIENLKLAGFLSSIEDIEYAILELNGQISIIPKNIYVT